MENTPNTASTMGLMGSSTGTTFHLNNWSSPTFVKSIELPESLEFIYKQYSMVTFGWDRAPEERAFKIIYSCVDGKWNKSEPIYGKVIPAQNEDYEFDDRP